jgi:hypothetical protein
MDAGRALVSVKSLPLMMMRKRLKMTPKRMTCQPLHLKMVLTPTLSPRHDKVYSLEESLATLINATIKTKKDAERRQKESGADIAAIASNFKITADALGGRVAAAAAHSKFKRFLTREEKRELEELQCSSDDSDKE